MCVYAKDDPIWFQNAVDSILQQTVKPTEVVLVVDGPVPIPLARAIAAYEKLAAFRVIRLPENKGHGEARRIGLASCRYELVALMDADDVSLPTRFEKQLAAFLADAAVSVVGGNIAEFTVDTADIVGYRIVPEKEADILAYMQKRCPLNQMTVMFKKSDVQQAGGYMDWYCNEDYYLWIRMYLAGMRFANLPDVLVYARVGKDLYKRRGGWRYFKSEARLQKYMLSHGVIGVKTCMVNVCSRFVLQVLMPHFVRGYLFQKFARVQNYERVPCSR